MNLTLRLGVPEDAERCGTICYEAFKAIAEQHHFPPDFNSPQVPAATFRTRLSHPGFHVIVAEVDGRVAGSNVLDERSTIAGLGPITVDPAFQNQTIGRSLMQAALDRVHERGFPGVRLLQAAFHNRSLSLYTKIGFEVREPMSVMQGPAIRRTIDGFTVRRAAEVDVPSANRVCEGVHGHNRAGELLDAIARGAAMVVERDGRITGYSSGLGYAGHAVAESNLDLGALIASAEGFQGPGILVPTRNFSLLRWCLENGLRVVQPMNLMTIGMYKEPVGAYLPSILY